MKLWIAKDKCGTLSMWSHIPRRCDEAGVWITQMCGSFMGVITSNDINITWESEPVEVKLSINGNAITIDSFAKDDKVIFKR